VIGKCTPCHVAFVWEGKPLLRAAACPYCKGRLTQTTHALSKLTWPRKKVHPLWIVGP